MAQTRILVVEDEVIVAENIRRKLDSMGYQITAIVPSGEEAIEQVEQARPDVVLMDIGLSGRIDGVAAAGRIRSRFDLPIIYLTAYADEETLERTRLTDPAGYLLKPFEGRELRVTIETALYKHDMERKLREREARLKAIFDTAGIAIALLDPDGRWQEVNYSWQQMLGYTLEDLRTLSLKDVVHPDDWAVAQTCFDDLLAGHSDGYRLEQRYAHKQGHFVWADVSVTPIRDANHRIVALVSAITDISKRKQAEQAWQDSLDQLRMAYKQAQIYAQDLNQDITSRKRAEAEVKKLNRELEQRIADRTRELSVLYDVAAVASEFFDLQTALEQLLPRVLEAMQSRMGVIYLLKIDDATNQRVVHQGLPANLVVELESADAPSTGLVGQVIERNEPFIVPEIATDPRLASRFNLDPATAYVGVPIRARGQLLGVLGVFKEKDQHPFNMDEITLLTAIADHVGVVVESSRLRQLAEQAAVMAERSRLARNLHDSVTQLLYSSTLLAEVGGETARQGNLAQTNDYLAELGEIARQALKEMRLLIYELRPPVLELEGLVGALQHRLDAVEGRAGVQTRLLADEALNLPDHVTEELYHIAQEALNNALKHAAATQITVQIYADGPCIELEITDNGIGFDPTAVAGLGGLGLTTMRERTAKLGGELSILSAPDQGTRVKVQIANGKKV